MKKDILGRDVPDGSLVAVRGTNKGNSISLKVGILLGGKVQCLEDSQIAKEMFLITNLDAEETEIRDKILDRLAKEKAESVKRAAERKTQIANLVGGIYKTGRNTYDWHYYLYCGEKRVTIFENGEIISQETGHLYLEMYVNSNASALTFQDFINRGNEVLAWEDYGDHFKILKGMKRYHEELHQVEVPARFQMTGVYEKYKPNCNNRYGMSFPPALVCKKERRVVVEDVYDF